MMYVCVTLCVHKKLFLGTLGLCLLHMWLGGSGQSRGTGCVSALPESRASVFRQNLYRPPVMLLGSSQALPWVGAGPVGRPMLGQVPQFLELLPHPGLPYTSQLGTWERAGGHRSFKVELPGQPQRARPGGQRAAVCMS